MEGSVEVTIPPCPFGFHQYSESSGRNRLARGRAKGNFDLVMWYCECHYWHVEEVTVETEV